VKVFLNNFEETDKVLQGSIQISHKTDGIRSCSVSFIDTTNTIQEGDEIEIFDGLQTAENKVFGGIIKSISAQYLTPLTERPPVYPIIQVDVQSDGYEFITNRRIVNVSRTNVGVEQIVREMLNILDSETIFEGNINTGPDIASYNVTYKTIKEVLDDMANVAGYVWYIDNQRRLQFTSQIPGEACPFELVQNGPFTDFHDLSWASGLDNYANKVFVIGASGIVATRENSAEIARRSAEADGQGTGVYGFVIQDSNLTTLAMANAVADNHLRKYAVSPGTLSFSSYTKGWKPGTKLKVQLPQITGFNSSSVPTVPNNIWYYVIEEVNLERENGKVTKYNISATRRYDTDFSTQKSAGFAEYFKNLVKK
jgi:hypothetical protein